MTALTSSNLRIAVAVFKAFFGKRQGISVDYVKLQNNVVDKTARNSVETFAFFFSLLPKLKISFPGNFSTLLLVSS